MVDKCTGVPIKQSGFELWPGTVVFLDKTHFALIVPLSPPPEEYKKQLLANCKNSLTKMLGEVAGGLPVMG